MIPSASIRLQLDPETLDLELDSRTFLLLIAHILPVKQVKPVLVHITIDTFVKNHLTLCNHK